MHSHICRNLRPKLLRYAHVHAHTHIGIFKHELKFVDMTSFLPTKNLKPHNIMELCQYIFNKDTKVKPELRKGVWMHLVGVYHPDLKSRREREDYIERLRRVYDSLKGKFINNFP